MIKNPEDREIRLIEAKWVSEKSLDSEMINQAVKMEIKDSGNYKISRFLLLSVDPGKQFVASAKSQNVQIVTLQDLF